MGKDVQLAVKRGRVALQNGADWKKLLAAVFSGDDLAVEPGVQPFPDLPKQVDITPEVAQALVDLPRVFNSVSMKTRRELTGKEAAALLEERQVLKTLEGLLEQRLDAVNTTVKHHMDTHSEVKDYADPVSSQRDRYGHYVLAQPGKSERVAIPGTNMEWSREYRSQGPDLDGDKLLAMYEAGEISREDYLAFTREKRVLDEDKVMEAVIKDPRRLEILAKIGNAKPPATSLFVRKAKQSK